MMNDECKMKNAKASAGRRPRHCARGLHHSSFIIHSLPSRWRRRAGFTLIELLVSIGLMAIIALMISIIFTTAYAAFQVAISTVRIHQNARAIVNMMRHDLEGANILYIGPTPTSGYFIKLGWSDPDPAFLRSVTAFGTPITLIDGGAAWTIDQWRNCYVTAVDAVGSEQRRLITGNGLNVLIVTPVWATIPDATFTYRITPRLGFVTTSRQPGIASADQQADIYQVEYILKPVKQVDAEDGIHYLFNLGKAVDAADPPDGDDFPTTRNPSDYIEAGFYVERLDIRCYESGDWVDVDGDWTSTGELPAAVEIRLRIADEHYNRVFDFYDRILIPASGIGG